MRHKILYVSGAAFSLSLMLVGILLDDPANILPGLRTILDSQDVLITDYIALAGPGAAFVNSGLVTLCVLGLMRLVKDPLNGPALFNIALMAGFSLFGKNILNIWPIILGVWLFSKVKRQPFGQFVSVALLATSLSPLVSFAGLNTGWNRPLLGFLLGLLAGFVIVPLSDYTYRLQNGINLYNMGFACGLLAMVVVPLMSAFGMKPERVLVWATGYNLPLGIYLGSLCAVLAVGGLLAGGRDALKRYWSLLHTTGRSPSDYVRKFGFGAVLLNMGVNGAVATAFILLTGGDLNGPTVGCILAVIGFSGFGKHVRNILPVMLGVLLGSLLMQFSINDPAVQIAALLCTTLAPVSGCFGAPFGLLAGFLHSALVLEAGSVAEGINLYNNGFSGGLLSIVLYPVLTAFLRHSKAVVPDKDYLEPFLGEGPLSPEEEENGRGHDVNMPR